MARIGIIIPTYNSESYINRCLCSILNQSYEDYEIIAINDGSTDNSLELLNQIKDRSKGRIKIINQDNKGVLTARKVGLENSDSEYICFIDSDDYIERDYLEKLYKKIKYTNSNICCSRFKMHFNIKLINSIGFSDRKKGDIVNLKLQKEKLLNINVVSTAKIFKREFINFPSENFEANEDLSINYYNFALANKISFENSTAYHYLPNSNGLVSKKINSASYNDIIKTTIKPLVSLKQRFIDGKIYTEYINEIEAIFIKNIFERISYICKNVQNEEIKISMIDKILNILSYEFPNWRDNIYYRKNFINLELTDIGNVLNVKKIIKSIKKNYIFYK